MVNLSVCYIYKKLDESIEMANRAINIKADYKRLFCQGISL